ncbi:hypothetical protein BpHYR1_018446 [Brachionus plicatilis]|uniref:Uncharacterized protein n=1 Tax=Brachionus plicatilis TaxID=10195 RepID=A0A3M7P9G2_BRAPC|nr:hypothetical protein BpHYR1_018446 [Brachionus plicatilis]
MYFHWEYFPFSLSNMSLGRKFLAECGIEVEEAGEQVAERLAVLGELAALVAYKCFGALVVGPASPVRCSSAADVCCECRCGCSSLGRIQCCFKRGRLKLWCWNNGGFSQSLGNHFQQTYVHIALVCAETVRTRAHYSLYLIKNSQKSKILILGIKGATKYAANTRFAHVRITALSEFDFYGHEFLFCIYGNLGNKKGAKKNLCSFCI